MTTRIWTKTETQTTIRALRHAGYHVRKHYGYIYMTDEKDADGQCVFTAMLGRRGYLVRYNPDLFQAAPSCKHEILEM